MILSNHGGALTMSLRTSLLLAVSLPATLAAQRTPVESGVRHLTFVPAGETVLPIDGPTMDLAQLGYRRAYANVSDSATVSADERLIIIDDGIVRVSVNGLSRVLGRGSVAVIMPGDAATIQNAGAAIAPYSLFTYRSTLPADTMRAKRAGGSFMVDWNDVVRTRTATGAVRRIFDRATSMLARFEMHVSTLSAGLTNHPPRGHRAEEMVVLLNGSMTMVLGATRQRAQTGDIAFIASQLPNSFENTGTTDADYIVMQWQP